MSHARTIHLQWPVKYSDLQTVALPSYASSGKLLKKSGFARSHIRSRSLRRVRKAHVPQSRARHGAPMRKPSNPLQELVRLVKVAEEGSNEIGAFLRLHSAELALSLNVPEPVLLAAALEPDELLAKKVAGTLRKNKEDKSTASAEVAMEAAKQVAASATWNGDAAYLDTRLLLGKLLVDTCNKYIEFELEQDKGVAVERRKLLLTSQCLRNRTDLFASVDSKGLHFRWSRGRGGLNWYPQLVVPIDRSLVQRVSLIREPAKVVVQNTITTTKKGSSWAWDAFADFAY